MRESSKYYTRISISISRNHICAHYIIFNVAHLDLNNSAVRVFMGFFILIFSYYYVCITYTYIDRYTLLLQVGIHYMIWGEIIAWCWKNVVDRVYDQSEKIKVTYNTHHHIHILIFVYG